MGAGGRELVATDEPTVVSEPCLDAIVVEDSQSDGSFSNPPWTDESDWSEAVNEADNFLNQQVTPKTGPWRRGREFTECARGGCETLDGLVVEVADLVRVWASVSVDSAVERAWVTLTR